MSEWKVEVVTLGKIGHHPNADVLDITHVYDYPCIVRRDSFREGDRAVYVPVDSLVPVADPRFAFLVEKAKKGFARIKAMRLRGIFSMGLLVEADADMVVGQDVAERLGITKYEPPESISMGGDTEADPGFLTHYDIESLRRWPKILRDGEEVVVTEEIHGADGRWAFWHRAGEEDRLWIASRRQFKKPGGDDIWNVVARQYDLEAKLSRHPGFALYGQVQDLRYGAKPGEVRVAFFDVLDIETRTFLDHDKAQDVVLVELDLPWVPFLYRGRWYGGLSKLAEGQSLIADHVREGMVVKPVVERRDDRIGRVILKRHGEGYLTRKGG